MTEAIFVACTKVHTSSGTKRIVHRGVVADLIAEGTGGTATTVLRSTLTGETWRANPNVVWRMDGVDEDTRFDIISGCRCLD